MESKVNHERRALVKTAVLAGTAAVVTGVPLISYVVAPTRQQGHGRWIDFGAVREFTPGNIEKLSYEFMAKDGWLVLPQRGFVWAKMEAEGTLTIFSSLCTHLSCNVSWREETREFECPCHSGSFDANGRPLSGPPSKPLVVLEHRVEEGNLQVFLTFGHSVTL